MNSIRILSERVASQIAAGEVIERPASVVRELIDNSIDAGADRITVSFEKGGKGRIRVQDNGSGMLKDDLLLCSERHATSKINNLDDHTYKQLKLIAEKDAITIKEVIIAALKNYVIEKELEYKRELINFEEDDGYQQPDQ